MVDRDALAKTLVELADTLIDDFDLTDLLGVLVVRCVEILPVDAAGLMLSDQDGGLTLAASSSEATKAMELIELGIREGPCVDCHRTGEPVLNQDLATTHERWATFTPAALDAGFRSAHAIPMRHRGRVVGALNLFGSGPGVLSNDAVVAGQALADMATISILQERATLAVRTVNAQLSEALTTRVTIEQAKGLLAGRSGVELAVAFEALRRHARSNRLRLVDVAGAVVDGTLTDL